MKVPPRSHDCGARCPPRGHSSGSGRPFAAASNRGFSLIEVLVAFVILALVATVLFRLFSTSLTNAAVSEEWSRALQVAESHLASAAAAQPLKEAADRGTDLDGRVSWEANVTPYVVANVDPDLDRASETLAMRLLRITVDVKYKGGDGRERTLSLATVRMGPRTLQ